MVEISDFNRLFRYTADDIYGMMIKYKQDHEEEFKEMVICESLVKLWNDCGNKIDDYIMDVCENPINAWCVLTHYEHDPVRLLYGYSDAQTSLAMFNDAIVKEVTNRFIEELK